MSTRLFFRWFVLLLVCAALGVVGKSASRTFNGATGSIEVSYDAVTHLLHYTTSGNSYGPITDETGTWTSMPFFSIYWSAPGVGPFMLASSIGINQSGSIDLQAAAGYYLSHPPLNVYATARVASGGPGLNPGDAISEVSLAPPPAAYGINFPIPANNTADPIIYLATQGGNVVGVFRQESGASASTLSVNGLTGDGAVSLQQVTGGFLGDDGTNLPVILPDTQSKQVNSGSPGVTPTNAGPTASPGALPKPANLSAPTPGVDLVPTPQTGGSAPIPNPTPDPVMPGGGSGTGATSGDIQAAASAIVAGENAINATSATNANGIIDAVNKGILAANGTGNGLIAAVNQATKAIDKVNESLDKSNAYLDGLGRRIDRTNELLTTGNESLKILSDAEDKREKDAASDRDKAATATASAAAAGAAAGTAAAQLFSQSSVPTMGSFSPGSSPEFKITFPSQFGGGIVDCNPFNGDRLGPVCSWFRGASAWLALILLGAWVWSQVGEWVRGFSNVQQAKGNPVLGGTGAQATALVAAGAMTVAIVTGLTGILAWTYGDIGLSAIRSAMSVNPFGGMAGSALWMLDQVFPCATLVGCLVARLSFSMYAAPLFATCAATVRFIVP